MTYLLDTNACIQFLNPGTTAVPGHLAAISREEVAICQIVKAELYYGAYKSARREANLALLTKFFKQFVSLPFDDAAAEAYGRLRAELARRGTPIGPNDLMIAAIASRMISRWSRTTRPNFPACLACVLRTGNRPISPLINTNLRDARRAHTATTRRSTSSGSPR
jgi:tRNA(fMet)-specific endonuclease VapC